MGPYIFFRVEDKDSRARYFGEGGLFAEDTDTRIDFKSNNKSLLREVERHLDWGNRVPTPFISMYCDEDVALREANRRVEEGKEDVRVYEINMRRSAERREYRNIRRLAERLELDIPERAWNNSEYEYIFLHHVPDIAVVGWIDLLLEWG
jgi:hypothetical protein